VQATKGLHQQKTILIIDVTQNSLRYFDYELSGAVICIFVL